MAFDTLLRPTLLAAARSSRLERMLTKAPFTKNVVSRFVAGTRGDHALAVSMALTKSGRSITVDYLGEDTTDVGDARAVVGHYLRLLPGLQELASASSSDGEPRNVEVSLKLSAMGQALPGDGHTIALDNARRICAAAELAGCWVTVDAEDHTTTDSTLAIVQALRMDFPHVGAVLQAYLRRTEGDCRDLAGVGSRIRLCKGAYKEPASVASKSQKDIDESYLRCMRILMDGRGYPMIASHDPAMIAAALDYATLMGRSSDQFELQMLYGVREAEQIRLSQEGHRVRVYVPYGQQWYGYFMRRLAERPANLKFFARSLMSG